MNDALKVLGHMAVAINRANGFKPLSPQDWENYHRVMTCLTMIHGEVSEASEAVRNDDFANFGEELADVIIRTGALAVELGVDLDEEVVTKLEKNKQRSHKHGGKRV